MDLLALAKNVADRIEAEATKAKVPVAVCVIDIHGNVVLTHRMNGAPVFSLEIAERWRGLNPLRRLKRWWKSGQPFFNSWPPYFNEIINLPIATVRAITGGMHPDVSEMLQRWKADLSDQSLLLIHRMRRHDVDAYMPGSVLAKVDRMSMRYALEVRCPLLDVRLARWAARLP